MHCDEKGVATHIFVQMEGGMKDWANCPSPVLLLSNGDIIVLFSISTHLFCYLLRVCNSVFMRL